MLTKEQINLINTKVSTFEPCVRFAQKYLELPEIEIEFKDCPSNMFPTMDNVAESRLHADGSGLVSFNAPWFAQRIEDHQDDVEFFLFHELRHIHQLMQIRLMANGGKIRETLETVIAWKNGFENYRRNSGRDSQVENVTQEVEIDANAYGIILEMLYHKGIQPSLSLPDEAFYPANERLQRYFDTLPEFRQNM